MRFRWSCLTLVPALALAAASAPAWAAPNLVTNGSFETTNMSGQQHFAGDVVGWGGGGVNGLTYLDPAGTADAPGSLLRVYGPFPNHSPDGGNFVEADGDPTYAHAITQTLNGLVVGNQYDVTFDQAAGQQNNFTGPTTEQWAVSLGADTQYSAKYSLPQGGVGAWQAQSLVFTATAASEVLSFLAVGTPNGAPPVSFLDGVSAVDVPEPGSLALIAAALLGVGGLVLARRRAASRSTTA